MAYIDFIGDLHKKSQRNYRERVLKFEKDECAEIAKKWGYDYWDGKRQYGFGGYHYDGRWRSVAEKMAEHYNLAAGDHILDIGCGKGYLLYEFTQIIPDLVVAGIDISEYAIENSKEEVKPFLKIASAEDLPFPDDSQDFIFSVTTLHNLFNYQLYK